MEVTTKEIIRYIDIRFKEQDLKKLLDEIATVENNYKKDYYKNDKLVTIKSILELGNVISNALEEIKQ